MGIGIQCEGFMLPADKFPDNIKGKVMWDIAHYIPSNCSNAGAYLEMLEGTTDDVLERVLKHLKTL